MSYIHFQIRFEILFWQILYTGDYSRQEDRHLMAAEVPNVRPDIVIIVCTKIVFWNNFESISFIGTVNQNTVNCNAIHRNTLNIDQFMPIKCSNIMFSENYINWLWIKPVIINIEYLHQMVAHIFSQHIFKTLILCC